MKFSRAVRVDLMAPALLVAAALLTLGCLQEGPPAVLESKHSMPNDRQLNVIVVSFDAMRPDVLAPYGGLPAATPNIDAFGEQSTVFEHAYSVAPVTPTSFAAFLSGRLPTYVFRGWRFEANPSLSSSFSDAGYLTAAFINNVWMSPERGFDAGFHFYDWRRNDPDEKFLESVLQWFDANRASPFLVWIHFLTPHAPYVVVPEAQHLYSGEYTGRFDRSTGNTFEATDENDISRIRELYLGEVWTADLMFGTLMSHLRKLDLLGSSIVVLTSDHGEEFGEHGGFQHGRLYEEHLRIPMILYHPERAPARISDRRFRSVDLLPTLLHLVGQPTDSSIDGMNVFAEPPQDPLPVVGISMTGAEESWISLLEASNKLIVTCLPERSAALFDVAHDPTETTDLAHEDPEAVARLYNSLSVNLGGEPCETMQRAAQGRNETTGIDPRSVEAMRALGYIE